MALVEKAEVGGTCLHSGYIPTKALLRAAEVADTTREAARFGVTAAFSGVDMNGVNAYKDDVAAQLPAGRGGQSPLPGRLDARLDHVS